MTLYLVDIASYQHSPVPINLDAAKANGVSLVNIKATQGSSYVFSAGRTYADKARSLGMGICTFHWLNGNTSGATQADHFWKQILNLGGPEGMAIECDCEDTSSPATWQIFKDFVNSIQDRLGRHLMVYSGDWWWQPRGWNGASLTPFYTAAPNDGYLGSYPGDNSRHWTAGYGGWSELSMMQYAVGPMSGVGGGDLSKSAIRDAGIWAALTGGDDVTAQEVWDYKIYSPAWNMNMSAREWLKYTVDATKAAQTADAHVLALTEVVKMLAETIKNGGGSVDTAAILNGVAGLLQGWRNTIKDDTRDAVADANEAAAAALRNKEV